MKTVWKWTLKPDSTLEVPEGTTFLSVGKQMGQIVAWGLVDPSKPLASRRIKAYGTGHAVPDDPGKFIGTVTDVEGIGLVFHFFETKA